MIPRKAADILQLIARSLQDEWMNSRDSSQMTLCTTLQLLITLVYPRLALETIFHKEFPTTIFHGNNNNYYSFCCWKLRKKLQDGYYDDVTEFSHIPGQHCTHTWSQVTTASNGTAVALTFTNTNCNGFIYF